jgi:poly-gamma-glutamate synthesis protein (capsule biosynthesis protein)
VPSGFVAEAQGELATYQRPLGHALVDAGADAVIGHHPHVLHGIELYRERPIFYSLGNLLFHSLLEGGIAVQRPYPPYSLRSLMGELNHHGGLADLTWDGPGPPSQIGLVPIWLNGSGEPTLSVGERAQAALNRVTLLSERFGTALRVRDGRLLISSGIPASQDEVGLIGSTTPPS